MNLHWDFTLCRSLAIILIWPLGYLTHELMHVLPLAASGAEYEVEFNPGDRHVLWNLTVGRAFEFRSRASSGVAVVSYLAPGLLALPALYLWAVMLRVASLGGTISVSSAVFVGSWFMVFLPSLSDWVKLIRILRDWNA